MTGAARREAGAARGENIIAEELRRRRWKEADLARRSKTDAAKVALAARLRKETTMTIRQIAERLHMGTRNTLNAQLHQHRNENG